MEEGGIKGAPVWGLRSATEHLKPMAGKIGVTSAAARNAPGKTPRFRLSVLFSVKPTTVEHTSGCRLLNMQNRRF